MGFQGVQRGDKGLQGMTIGYIGFQGVKRGLHRVTRAYKRCPSGYSS